MITIYHNPRCRKSRETLKYIENSGEPFEIVEYLKEPLTAAQIQNLLGMLGIGASSLVRKNEAIWKEQYRGKELSEAGILKALETHPKLMERPVVVKGKKAVLGRPPENVLTLLNKG
ncbi:MAG: arsenate reductase (glutaredoxin) [Robiginitalea sp.]|jgi:arsenate reductase